MTRDPAAPNPRAPEEQALRGELVALRTQQERLFADMLAGQRHFRAMARSVWRIEEAERRRLARDLHDGVGQNLTALRQTLAGAVEEVAANESLHGRLTQALAILAQSVEEIRALSRALRPQVLDDLGLASALAWLGRTVGGSAGFSVAVDCIESFPDPEGDLSTLVFRVTQEALANAARHSKCRHVLLRVSRSADTLNVLIADDGVGCEVEVARASGSSGASTGLASMRERVGLFGGQFSIVSAPGSGFQVRAALPLGLG
jgi:signal transduction histidine kinase